MNIITLSEHCNNNDDLHPDKKRKIKSYVRIKISYQ